METASHINVIPEQAKTERSLRVFFTPDEEPFLLRLFNTVLNPFDRTKSGSVPDSDYVIKIGNVDRVDADFRFLQSNTAAPFAIRLALELAEASRVIRR